jgi:TRAP-type uncharacterized transport system substrate-binding protein
VGKNGVACSVIVCEGMYYKKNNLNVSTQIQRGTYTEKKTHNPSAHAAAFHLTTTDMNRKLIVSFMPNCETMQTTRPHFSF